MNGIPQFFFLNLPRSYPKIISMYTNVITQYSRLYTLERLSQLAIMGALRRLFEILDELYPSFFFLNLPHPLVGKST